MNFCACFNELLSNPPEKRGSALGLIGAVFGISFLIGPIVAGILLNFSWRYLFVINIPIALVIGFLAVKYLPTRRKENCGTIDWVGIILASSMLVCLAIGIYSINTEDFIISLLSIQCLRSWWPPWCYFSCFVYMKRKEKNLRSRV